jgi:acetate kinase
MKAKAPGGGEGKKWEIKTPAPDHVSAMSFLLEFLHDNVSSSIKEEVKAVGHRVVHGLDISKSSLLTPETVSKIKGAVVLAPLHNPPALQGIFAAQEVFGPATPMVGVFDTAFHQTMPDHAFMYGLPYDLYEKHAVRRYGFHGTSHQYLTVQAAAMLNKPVEETNIITCHLGNGSSITAVKGGKSVDTSMGMTPLEGLLMGTRCGDMDPAIVLHLQNQLKLSTKDTDTLLNKKSGLLGVCGNSDLRSVIDAAAAGEVRSALALKMFVYRVQKYIGSYTATLGGNVDAIIFSAGIGENSSIIRRLICNDLKGMGIELDDAANRFHVSGPQGDISLKGSKVRVLVIPTDEELSIAQQTAAVVKGSL